MRAAIKRNEIPTRLSSIRYKFTLNTTATKIQMQTAATIEYSCAVTPQVRQTGNRLSGLAGTAYASLLT